MKSRTLIGLILLFSVSSCLDIDPSSASDQLTKDVKKIDDYLAANPPGPSEFVVRDASGIRLLITEMGAGTIPPNSGNNLKVTYVGRLFSDGTVFDSNDSGFNFKLSDDIINGWKIGLSLMTQGTKAKLFIPSGWAYGENGRPGTVNIPPNAILVFDINLVSVVPTQPQIDKLQDDVEAIDAYLATNTITAETHASGIRYVITELGTGPTPVLYDAVRINYKVKLMSNDFVVLDEFVEPSITFSSKVVNYPHAVLLGLQLLPQGSKATIYAPSTLAFGPTVLSNVPANSNIIFEVELLEVID